MRLALLLVAFVASPCIAVTQGGSQCDGIQDPPAADGSPLEIRACYNVCTNESTLACEQALVDSHSTFESLHAHMPPDLQVECKHACWFSNDYCFNACNAGCTGQAKPKPARSQA
jgi:hypothetical protein